MTRDEFIAECDKRVMYYSKSSVDSSVGAYLGRGHRMLPESYYTLAWEEGELAIYFDGNITWDAYSVGGSLMRKTFRLEMRGGDFETMYQSLKFFELTHVS